ncbi:MAG: hypothetical protein QM778_14485 [Myxococcales bacterium]
MRRRLHYLAVGLGVDVVPPGGVAALVSGIDAVAWSTPADERTTVIAR